MKNLISVYRSALHSDSTKAVFKGKKEREFYDAYKSLLQDLGNFLRENDFEWEKPVRCFNRIYFSKAGSIDYFIYDFMPGQIEDQRQEEFEKHVQRFIKSYKFSLKSDHNYAQCSPVTYKN